jgi:hypothetical protein
LPIPWSNEEIAQPGRRRRYGPRIPAIQAFMISPAKKPMRRQLHTGVL